MKSMLSSFAIVSCVASSHAFEPALPHTSRTTHYRSANGIRTSPLQATPSSGRTNTKRRNNHKDEGSIKQVPHDRTIDRRKSPALWRYDLEYSIPNASTNPTSFVPKCPPELMSPAGGYPQLKAAVANGADAVYLGLTSYSARARAANFDPDPSLLHAPYGDKSEYEPPKDGPASLAQAVQYAHRHRVRVYVAFNTLVFDEELHEVQNLITQIWQCGVDAVIIQDVGVAKIVKETVDRLIVVEEKEWGRKGRGLDHAPLEIHASTQQTVTCGDGVEFARERTNATRVVSVWVTCCSFVYLQAHQTFKCIVIVRCSEES